MTKEVDFYFDFASPNAYLSHKVLKSISEKTGAKVNYIVNPFHQLMILSLIN